MTAVASRAPTSICHLATLRQARRSHKLRASCRSPPGTHQQTMLPLHGDSHGSDPQHEHGDQSHRGDPCSGALYTGAPREGEVSTAIDFVDSASKGQSTVPNQSSCGDHPSWTRLSTPPESVTSVEDATQQLEGYLMEREREILTQARLWMSAGLNPNQLNFNDH